MSRRDYEKVGAPEASDDDDYSASDDDNGRLSEDVRRHDQDTLTAEEEAERLLSSSNEKIVDPPKRRRQHVSSRRKGSLQRTVMYDTEEGDASGSIPSSPESSELDLAKLGAPTFKTRRKQSGGMRWMIVAGIVGVISCAFLALLYGAHEATSLSDVADLDEGAVDPSPPSQSLPAITPEHSGEQEPKPVSAATLSNGTHTFPPTTLLLSLDGFRADFLTRHLTPSLLHLASTGLSPAYLTPSFPSLTFPNHYTLLTGLHPESHGIVGNTFFDPTLQREFSYTDKTKSMQPEWWEGAEPLWVTAEKAGVRAAVHMWPGSEAHIQGVEVSHVDAFNAHEKLPRKVDRILSWLDLPDSERPQFIAAYVPDIDADGHLYGPNSTYIRSTIAQVDGMISSLLSGLDARNLTHIVNVVVVSDHGMATTSTSRLIQFEDLLDPALIEHVDGWPLYGLRPFNSTPAHLQDLYTTLLAKSLSAQYQDSFAVYLRDTTMPFRFHFSQHARIAPLWLVPAVGWAIVRKHEFDVASARDSGEVYHPRGLHGYDNQEPLMRAIFIARGPAFLSPTTMKGGRRVPAFANTEVYGLLCESLGMEARANNGTLGLQGLLGAADGLEMETGSEPGAEENEDEVMDGPPEVPNLNFHPSTLAAGPTNVVPNLAARPSPPSAPSQPLTPARPEPPTAPTRPEVHDGATVPASDADAIARWREWMKAKLEAIKGWAVGAFGHAKGDEGGRKLGGDDGPGGEKGGGRHGGGGGSGGHGHGPPGGGGGGRGPAFGEERPDGAHVFGEGRAGG